VYRHASEWLRTETFILIASCTGHIPASGRAGVVNGIDSKSIGLCPHRFVSYRPGLLVSLSVEQTRTLFTNALGAVSFTLLVPQETHYK
jgi:hypothetical protein